jgi:cell division initiation protein
MDLSPKLLTDVQFREQWRGYKPEEVDEFLERVAAGVGELQTQLAAALDRAGLAERRLADRSDEDELRRTLVLAQRTADASIAEARAEAERLLQEAEERSRAIAADADALSQALDAELASRREQELGSIAEERAALERDVDALRRFVEAERSRLAELLTGQIDALHQGYVLADAPSVSEVAEVPSAPAPIAPAVEPRDEPPSAAPAPQPMAAPSPEPTAADDENDLRAAHDGLAEAMRRAGLEELIAEEGGDQTELFDNGEDTGSFGALTDLGEDDEPPVPVWREEPSAATEDDPFLAELRRAVVDTEPLGPRDPVQQIPGMDGDADDDASGGFLRRRRRS